jgi:hypothetical protein
MFILVEALSYTGWIRVFATWWGAWVDVGGVAGAVWLMGVISVLGCNIFGTNIGATVLLSSGSTPPLCRTLSRTSILRGWTDADVAGILQQWRASQGVVSDRILYGSVFTLAVGSNFGAYSFVYVYRRWPVA